MFDLVDNSFLSVRLISLCCLAGADKLIKDNSSLIVIDGEAAFHFFQKHVPNFYSPFADDIYENTRKFMEETMEDRDGATPEMLANGGTSLGVHIRHDDQASTLKSSRYK